MIVSIRRFGVASLLIASWCFFPSLEVSAGVLNGFPAIVGPGAPIGIPTAVTGAPNNDDYTGPGASNPNQISLSGINIFGAGPVDLVIPVTNSGTVAPGTTEYFLNVGNAVNNSGVAWSGFRVELGSGSGASFAGLGGNPIPNVVGLDFDFPTPDPLSSPTFATIVHGADLIVFTGGFVPLGGIATGQDFAFDIPDTTDPLGAYDFTIRLQPIPVPEPSGLLLFGCGLLGTLRASRKKKKSSQGHLIRRQTCYC